MQPVPSIDTRRRLCLVALAVQCCAVAVACSGGRSSSDTGAPPSPSPDPGATPPTSPPAPVPGPPAPAPTDSTPSFPIRVEVGKRYLVDGGGRPLLLHGDTPWSLVGQLTDAQIDAYLADRKARGFTAILFSAPEAYYTNQSPAYLNVDGVAPFVPMPRFSAPNERYWRRVDHAVDGAKTRGMICVLNPAYLGYQTDGWLAAVDAAADSELFEYGQWLARRYAQGNVIWSMGGDHDTPRSLLTKQWNIALGIRSVRANDVITAHQMSDADNADDAYTYWSDYAGFNLNWVYGYETNGKFTYQLCEQAYGREMPFVGFEFKYEGSADATPAMLRRQSYGALLSGACGQFYGNNPVWHFGSPRWSESYTGTWQSNLDSAGVRQQTHVHALFSAFAWWKLVPAIDASLVTSALGSGAGRLYPALASDRSFALIYVPAASTVSVRFAALASPNVRVRFYDPTLGTFEPVFANSMGNSDPVPLSTPGERIIVLDAPD